MNKVKVNDFVSAYSKVLGLDNNVKNILIELMENIIIKYENIIDYIPTSLDDSKVYLIKSINGKYSVEDFFLNRLMRNVWFYSEINENTIKEGFADEHTKGSYDASFNEVNINKIKLSNQLEKYKQYLGVNYLSMKSSAEKKVIMHEFEHGLQTRFDNQLNVTNRSVYKSISDELLKLGKYNDILNSYEILPKSLSDRNNYLSTGVYYSSYSESLGIKTYKNIDGYDNLNEILNETESLEMSNQTLYLNAILEDGNYYPFINPESSNSAITNYGFIIKILLGEQISFEGMYLNPQSIFVNFNNKYNNIFQTLYNSNNDAITILIEQLNVIKNSHKEEDILKLNQAFAQCLEHDINNDLKANISEDILKLKIENFSKYIVRNNDLKKHNQLNHVIILNKLKEKITYHSKFKDFSPDILEFLKNNGIDIYNMPDEFNKNMLGVSSLRESDYDHTLTYGNIIYENIEEKNVFIKDIVGSASFDTDSSFIELLSKLYRSNASTYESRNLHFLERNLEETSYNLLHYSEPLKLVEIDGKYNILSDGNHRVFYLLMCYYIELEKNKGNIEKIKEVEEKYKFKVNVVCKSNYKIIDICSYALSKSWFDDFRINFIKDKELICVIKYNEQEFKIKSELEFVEFFNNYLLTLDKTNWRYNKLIEMLDEKDYFNAVIEEYNNDLDFNNMIGIYPEKYNDKIKQENKDNGFIDEKKIMIDSLNKDLLSSKIKLNEYNYISFKQYLEEAFYPYIPDNNFVELKNGIVISTKQFIEEIVYENAEKYGRNIENLINDTINRKVDKDNLKGMENMQEDVEKNYEYYLDNIMKIILKRRQEKINSVELSREEKENAIFEIHENIKFMNSTIKSVEEMSKILDFVVENLGNDTFENKISNDILSSLPIKQFKEVKSDEISDNLNSKILYFVNKCKTLENSYNEFKNNNLKDNETLEELSSNNYLLKEEGILLLSQNISDEERKIVNYNIMLLQEQAENMKKFNFNLKEVLDDFNRKL